MWYELKTSRWQHSVRSGHQKSTTEAGSGVEESGEVGTAGGDAVYGDIDDGSGGRVKVFLKS